MLQNVVSTAMNDANVLMDRMGLPSFTKDMLEKVQGDVMIFMIALSLLTQLPTLNRDPSDFDVNTPGQGLMTLNNHLWGEDATRRQIDLLNTFDNPSKLQGS
jgi:hypothetical protein